MKRYAPLYLALIPTVIVMVVLALMFTYGAWRLDLPLFDAVPVQFTLGAGVLTYLVGLAEFAYRS